MFGDSDTFEFSFVCWEFPLKIAEKLDENSWGKQDECLEKSSGKMERKIKENLEKFKKILISGEGVNKHLNLWSIING